MAAHPKRLILVAALMVATGGLTASGSAGVQVSGTGRQAPARIISLVPALTEMLFAIGAGPQVIAVSSYDNFPAEVKALPKVGALLDPDTERILSLRPDLVITYGSQGELESQFARAGIRTFSYRHGGVPIVLETLRALGAATGHAVEADRAAREIQAQLDDIRARVRGRARPRTLLVFDRQPQSLQQMYVSGGVGFLHDMLEIAGGSNVFADVRREAVQPSHELLLVRAPEIILEVRAAGLLAADDVRRERGVWSALGSVPAIRNERILFLSGDYLVVPGPRVAQATAAFARALHPDAFR
jgi:iron complex transport system substrate-binding protein